jgi:type IV pilus assembly protein PilC
MTSYRYRGTAQGGIPVSGVVEAVDQEDAVAKARASCSVVTSVERLRESGALGRALSANLSELGRRRIPDKELSLLCSQLAIELKAGLPAVRSLELVAENTSDRRLKKIVGLTAKDVQAGHSLADSFAVNGKDTLPPTFLETVRAGEESGRLDGCFLRLKQYYASSANVRSKVISAMIYPIFLIAVAAVVIFIIMVKAVPTFSSTYKSMGLELPAVTKALIAVSDFFASFWLVLLAGILAAVAAAKLFSRTERGRVFFARLALRFPGTGRVNVMNAASQFSSTMSAMLASGLPMVQAAGITSRVVENYIIGLDIRRAAEDVVAGRRLCDGLRKSESLPGMLLEMTAVGEETGDLEETLAVVSDYYANEVETAVARALSILEPAIILVLAFLVVFILLAVYLPLFNLYGNI